MDSRTQHFQCETDLFSLYKMRWTWLPIAFPLAVFLLINHFVERKKNGKSKLICYPREQMMKHEYTWINVNVHFVIKILIWFSFRLTSWIKLILLSWENSAVFSHWNHRLFFYFTINGFSFPHAANSFHVRI